MRVVQPRRLQVSGATALDLLASRIRCLCIQDGLQRHDLTSANRAGMFSFDENLPEANRPYSDDDDVLNEAEVNGNWTPQEKALHEARLKAKAKRRLRKSSSRNSTSESISESGELAGSDPHSPKGKVNTNDGKSRTGKGRGLQKGTQFMQQLSQRWMRRNWKHDVAEGAQPGPPHKYRFSSLAVSLSLEGKASHRELTSRLLSDPVGQAAVPAVAWPEQLTRC
ncbi:programmed cell death protein 4-like protein [Lates japonicus]|uniref:Programmed cell death protein 4-like protein n=1 Tax=Lates japonicus TaxID=270547 RepID=A0AAD3NIE5_LATJO|nr:programmed cell death protein 4-like protein [Lates japonicus]